MNNVNALFAFVAISALATALAIGVMVHFESDATRDTIRAHGFLSERVREQDACEDCPCHCHCDACRCGGHNQRPQPQPPKPHGDAGPSGSKPPASGAAAP